MQDTFGIEEEFMLLDPRTLAPIPIAGTAIEALRRESARFAVTSEFLPSQIEHATSVCRTPQEARESVELFRRLLREWADAHDVIAMPSGTPFQMMDEEPELPSARYRRIARDVGHLTAEHLVNGMHVHVGISDPEEGVRVLNGLRGWLPLLLALSANSPLWAGGDTGHHSWRSIQTRRWTTYGIPPHLHAAAEHEALRRRLTGIGATQQYSTASWAVRLSENYPTVEVRVCDTQLTAHATVAMALLIRALAHACADPGYHSPAVRAHVLDAELWHAARYGLTNGMCDPLIDAHGSTADALAALERTVAPHLATQGSAAIVDAFLTEVASGRTGSVLQREALGHGQERLADLYREALTRPWPEPASSVAVPLGAPV